MSEGEGRGIMQQTDLGLSTATRLLLFGCGYKNLKIDAVRLGL